MEKQITYRWWQDDNDIIKIDHQEQLNDHAINHIYEMINKGFSSGNLIAILDVDEPSETQYDGYWELKTIN
jgi:uncharacterized protein YoaH (UPF0181 family)